MKPEERSKSSMSSAMNNGPGQGKYKAKIGNPIDLGLSSQSAIKGGSATKLRGVNNEEAQKPQTANENHNTDRGKFVETY